MSNSVAAELHKELRAGIVNGDTEDPRLEFARYGLEKEVLNKEKLSRLFKEDFRLFSLGQNKQANEYADKVIGTENNCRLKILAIILMHPQNSNFKSFRSCVEDDFRKLPATDADLPLSREQAESVFEDVGVTDFLSDQPIFLALEYRSGEPVRVTKEEMGKRRFPVIGKPTPIGRGASGKVEKIQVAPGFFQSKTGRNEEPLWLAQKVFDKEDVDASSGVENFLNEYKIAMRLEDGPADHKHLMKPLGSVRELESTAHNGKEQYSRCILLYELAKCNLSEALTAKSDQIAPPYENLEAKSNLMSQFYNLVHALYHLHENDIIHVDIKPDNVLVVENKDESSENPLDRWKLADYNLAKAKEFMSYHAETSSTSGKREAGAYQAPEVQGEGSRIGSWSDLWSLGCIFLVILTYLDQGADGVTNFEDLRLAKGVSFGSTTRRDRFYVVPESGHPEINPGVSETIRTLRSNAKKRDEREGKIVSEALDILMTDVLVLEPEERRRRNSGPNRPNFLNNIKKIARMYRYPELVTHEAISPPEEPVEVGDPLMHGTVLARSVTVAEESSSGDDNPTMAQLADKERKDSKTSGEDKQPIPDRRKSTKDLSESSPVERTPTSASDSATDHTGRSDEDPRSCTGLCIATQAPNLKKAKSLLKEGQRADETCPRCRTTPLHNAVQRNSTRSHLDILELFLHDDAGTTVTTRDNSERTALEEASWLSREKPIELLLDWYERKGEKVDWDVVRSEEHRNRQDLTVRRMIKKRKDSWADGQKLPN